MKNVKLHPVVNSQFLNIWFYTMERWGEQQADTYIFNLEKAIKKLAKNILHGKKYNILPQYNIYYLSVAKHKIFYLEENNGLLILSIFHKVMDIPNRIIEILEQEL